MNYSKPSVSVAVKNLKSRGYITVSEDGHLHLTDEGQRIAESVYERHTLLTDWLIHLGVDPQIAASDACKMEHDITPESYEAMKKCILSILGRD
ncbi:MAG: metal-dependent transcriptional regulator [Lachnospiraceae bacterium]|nr:metal-dependent transcriptional regulator [Lachnospiraceae bacterium]